MKVSRLILLPLLVALSSVGVNSQTVSKSSSAGKASRSESAVNKARFDQLAQEAAAIFLSFTDERTKSWALSQLADLWWAHDEPSARQFMQRALDTCSLSSTQSKSERDVLLSRRRTLINVISNHDADWARTLIEDDENLTDRERQDVNLATAYSLLENSPEKSVGFIERARASGIPDDLPFYLQALRSRNQSAADSLFASALSQLSALPFVRAEVVLNYGSYVFSAPGKGAYTISVRAVGAAMVPDISVNREGISSEIIKLYLSTAAILLERHLQTADPAQIGLNYYASRLLLEKAEGFAPDLVRAFRSNVAATANRVSDVYAADSSKQTALPPAVKSDEQDRLLTEFYDEWLQKDSVAAQKVLDRVQAGKLSDELQQVLNFKRIASDLEKGVAPAKIKPSILRMAPGVESALLWCALAHGYLRREKPNGAKESLVAAVSAASIVKDHRKAYLLLNVAKIYAAFNPSMAVLIFKDAVREFNALENDPPSTVSWNRVVRATHLSREFPLRLKGLSGDLADVVPELIREEDEEVYSVLLTLKDEGLKARALISYLKASPWSAAARRRFVIEDERSR